MKWAVVSPHRLIVSGRDARRCKRCRVLYTVVTSWQGRGEGKGFPEPLVAWLLRATGYVPYSDFLASFDIVFYEYWEPLGRGAGGRFFDIWWKKRGGLSR